MKKILMLSLCCCMVGSALAQDRNYGTQKRKGGDDRIERRGDRQNSERWRNDARGDQWWRENTGEHVMIRNSRRSRYEGRNRVFHISGNNIRVRITGDIRGIIVTGNNNRVTAEDVGFVEVRGNRNTVAYNDGLHREDPRITRRGNNNRVYDRTP
jgi:hypothetical protein